MLICLSPPFFRQESGQFCDKGRCAACFDSDAQSEQSGALSVGFTVPNADANKRFDKCRDEYVLVEQICDAQGNAVEQLVKCPDIRSVKNFLQLSIKTMYNTLTPALLQGGHGLPRGPVREPEAAGGSVL